VPSEEFVVALDVGGSLTKVSTAGPRGPLGSVDRLPTPLAEGSDGLVRWLADRITAYAAGRADAVCRGFGIVVPGIIDSATGTVRAAPNLAWYDVALRDRLTQLTGLDGVVAHDVRSGGLAEWRLGAGAGVANLLFLPLGTGIAGALVVDGRLLDADGYAGEIGHIRVPAAAELACACGQIGCLETVASAAGVVRTYTQRSGETALATDARRVADLAHAGDPAARAAFALASQALVEALMPTLTLLGPELVVIGGGLSAAADLLVPVIERGLAARTTFQRLPKIVAGLLGADAGVIGAGLLGWEHVRATGEAG